MKKMIIAMVVMVSIMMSACGSSHIDTSKWETENTKVVRTESGATITIY